MGVWNISRYIQVLIRRYFSISPLQCIIKILDSQNIDYLHHSVMMFYLIYNYNLSNWYMWFMYPFEFGHEQHNVVQKIELFSLFGKVKQSIKKASSILNRILEEYVLFLLIMYIYLIHYLISEEKQRFVFDPLEIRRE